MANQSYIRILQAIELFAQEHLQVKKFASDFPGQMPNFATKNEAYPILFVSPNSSVFDQNTTTFILDVYCFDIIQKDRDNINTILSDTNAILSDLNRWIVDGQLAGFDIIGNAPTVIPLNNALLDYAAGWEMQLRVECETYGICEIPFNNIPSISTEVNNICYDRYLTCSSLNECDVIIDIKQSIVNIKGSATVTGGTYNQSTGISTFTNSTGGTFTVDGFSTGYTLTNSGIVTALGYTPYNSNNPNGYISGFTITSSGITTALGYTPYNSSNPNGFISGITSSNVTSALGYTPYNSSNPNGYITGFTITSNGVTTALGYVPYNANNPSNYISGITSSNVTTALGYTPYNSTNPAGYITSFVNTFTTGGTYSNGSAVYTNNAGGSFTVNGFSTGYTLTNSGITTALGYTPYNSTNPNGFISGITSGNVTTALGFTPYNSTNPNNYISGITSGNVTTALGYTPYNSTNPNGYITAFTNTFTTGGTYSNGSALFINNAGGSFTVNGFSTGYTLTNSGITTALGYVPYNASNPNGYISGITSGNVTTALGYIPYNSNNPAGYITAFTNTFTTGGTHSQATGVSTFTNNAGGLFTIGGYFTGITSSNVITALGYTPYDSSNPSGYITSSSNLYLPISGGTLTGTNNTGFLGFIPQSGTIITPSSGFRLFADNTGKFSWVGSNGFVRTFDGTSNTASRVYTLPNRDIMFDNITTATTTNIPSGFLVSNGSTVSVDTNTYVTDSDAFLYACSF